MKTNFEKWEAQVKRQNRIAKSLMLFCAILDFVGGYLFTHQGSDVLCIIGCIMYVVGFWMFYMAVE